MGNGSVYMVKGFDRQGNIHLTNGWTLSRDFSHINHAYCSTDFGAQGRTVEHVLVVVPQKSYPAVNKRGLYVDVSRGRESATVYVDDKARRCGKSSSAHKPRLSATEARRQAKDSAVEADARDRWRACVSIPSSPPRQRPRK